MPWWRSMFAFITHNNCLSFSVLFHLPSSLDAHLSSNFNQTEMFDYPITNHTTGKLCYWCGSHQLPLGLLTSWANVSHCVSFCSTHSGVGAWLILPFACTLFWSHCYCLSLSLSVSPYSFATCLLCLPPPPWCLSKSVQTLFACNCSLTLAAFGIMIRLCCHLHPTARMSPHVPW